MKLIARIYNGFETKFGIPRQSGLAHSVKSEIIFEPEFRNPAAVKGLDAFSHIWLLWNFSESDSKTVSLTVRPPRLGGNKRVGVFATRSPFRPNPIGLSAVMLEKITYDEIRGPVLTVSGADLMNGTPIYDIKPYIPLFDSIPDAKGGFTDDTASHSVAVIIDNSVSNGIPEFVLNEIKELLPQDPKPSYQHDENRVYGMKFSGYEIKFRYNESTITVTEISPCNI